MGIVGLARLMVLAADDQNVAVGIGLAFLQPHIVIRLKRVPIECIADGVFRNTGTDHVRHVGRLLGMERDEVVDRRVRGHDDGVGDDLVLADFDRRGVAPFDVVGVAVAVDLAALVFDRLCDGREIL
jgi:hypothetical protein